MHELRIMADGIAKNFGLDPRLLAAIIEVESGWRPYAVRFEPIFNLRSLECEKFAKDQGITVETERMLSKCSWGLGQVMGATARWCGFTGPLPQLCDPYQGALWAAKYLVKIGDRYKQRNDQIAAYNAGSATFDEFKNYKNQPYVDKVLKLL